MNLPSVSRLILVTIGLLTGSLGLQGAPFKPTQQDAMVPADAKQVLVWGGGAFTEGPAVAPDGSIYFSDIGNTIHRHDPKTSRTEVWRKNSGKANGLMFDRQGRLVACEGANGGNRRISITLPDGSIQTLADRWNGKRFNSPNDLVIASNGNLYFTDPRYVGEEPREIEFEGIFLVRPDKTVSVATHDVRKPNGILISPSGTTLYAADHEGSGIRQLVAFTVGSDGLLRDKKVLHDFGRSRGIDGMTMDREGNIYAAAGSGEESGIYVFDPEGRHLALIRLPGDPTNCVFGTGAQARTLYITAQSPEGQPGPFGLFSIPLKKPGYHPSQKK